MRWKAHNRQLQYLADTLKKRLLIIRYEDLATQTRDVLARLEQFTGLSCPLKTPEIKTTSIDKWCEQLSDIEIEHINAGLSDAPIPPHSRM